jgi:predicted ATP-dependent endonuclease of OLD family
MKLKLQNIGIIEEADVNIDGITLIAGQNDSGKSTVGKVLYALIRGVNIDEERFYSSKNEFIRNKIRDVRNLLLRTKSSNENDDAIKDKFITLFLDSDKSVFTNRNLRIGSDEIEYVKIILNELDKIKELFQDFSNESTKNQLETLIEEIKTRIEITIDSKDVLHYELEEFFENEFGNQIQNKFKSGDSFVLIEDDKKIQFKETIHFEGFDSLSTFHYDDVFYIESPLILQEDAFLFFDKVLRNKNKYLNHKIYQPKKEQDIFSDTSDKTKKLNQVIFDIINGGFVINSIGELKFKRQEVEFDLTNVATGIKSFGILQMLLENESLNSNSLLILDEPEVHLHPNWQVKYAEILVLLSKELAIPIVMTSHSPYFIEALEAYSKKYKYESSTNFYFAKKNEDGLSAKITDVTENISPILSSISEAFYTIQDLNDED